MNTNFRLGKLIYLANFHFDFLLSLLLTEVIYLFSLVSGASIIVKFSDFITLFVAIFSVNFTVFAISKYLLKNYSKIGSIQIRKNIDAVFMIPIKVSIIGILVTIFFSSFNTSFLDNLYFIVFFFVFYSIFSSYYAFKLVYEMSIHNGNE